MKNGKLKIEAGVPMPPVRGLDEYVAAMKAMKVGDSFLYPKNDRHQLYGRAARARIKIASRTEGVDHVRVWRVE